MPHATASSLGLGHWGSMKAIEEHSSAIWLGDLNYRLNLPPGFSDEDTIKAIRLGRLGSLLEADQLCREMAANRVFNVSVASPLDDEIHHTLWCCVFSFILFILLY